MLHHFFEAQKRICREQTSVFTAVSCIAHTDFVISVFI